MKRKNVEKRNGGKRAVADINKTSGWRLCKNTKIEAIWHLFLWAIVANKREMAEHFLFETDCIIGDFYLVYRLETVNFIKKSKNVKYYSYDKKMV